MTEYDFTLKFKLQISKTNPAHSDPNAYVEQLYASGCDDALIGVGKIGYISLNFLREAASAFTAIASAMTDVKKAIPDAILIEATPDFVGLTDVAKMLGCTRQNIRNLIVKGAPKSPLPVYEGTPSIWHLADILIWLREDQTYAIDDSLLDIAQTNMKFNIARDWQKIEPALQEDIKTLVV